MESHFNLSNAEFKKQFANCSLDPTVFSHEAHLRMAWLLIHEQGLQNAEDSIQDQLQKFVSHLGETDKYHVTVTLVAMKAVHHFIQRSKAETFKEFIVQNPRLKSNFKELVNSHYSFDIFSSDEARSKYLEPDLLPFT
jgi:N-formylglutamate deformylase